LGAQDLLNKIDGAFSAGKPRYSEGNLMHLTCVDNDSLATTVISSLVMPAGSEASWQTAAELSIGH
jgi:hypothetical protein